MAIGSGSLHERLINAYYYNLLQVDENHLSGDLLQELNEIKDRMLSGESDVRLTVSKMTNEQASEIVGRIYDLYAKIAYLSK